MLLSHRQLKKIKLIKNLKIALNDFEPYVKNPDFLIKGREFTNFSLRPREAWANWLICAVLQKLYGEHITFAEDRSGDGFFANKKTGEFIPTEHVSALENPFNKLPEGEDRIIGAINQKINRGPGYAKGKWLVVFFDGAGKFYRNKIRENIYGRHGFSSIFCVGLLNSGKNGYSYVATEFKDFYGDASVTFKIEINGDFTDWKISQIMQ